MIIMDVKLRLLMFICVICGFSAEEVRKLEYKTLVHIQLCRKCTMEMLNNEPYLIESQCHSKNLNDTSYPWCLRGDAPTCSPIPEIKNGKIIYQNENLKNVVYTWIRVKCNPGYIIANRSSNNEEVYCQDNYSWSENVPECQKNACPDPKLEDGTNATYSYEINGIPEFWIGSAINFTCRPGYHLSMNYNPEIKCLENRTWSSDVPVCQKDSELESSQVEEIVIGVCASVVICLIVFICCLCKRKYKKGKEEKTGSYTSVPCKDQEKGNIKTSQGDLSKTQIKYQNGSASNDEHLSIVNEKTTETEERTTETEEKDSTGSPTHIYADDFNIVGSDKSVVKSKLPPKDSKRGSHEDMICNHVSNLLCNCQSQATNGVLDSMQYDKGVHKKEMNSMKNGKSGGHRSTRRESPSSDAPVSSPTS